MTEAEHKEIIQEVVKSVIAKAMQDLTRLRHTARELDPDLWSEAVRKACRQIEQALLNEVD